MLAAIYLIPVICYGAVVVGGAFVSWLIDKPPTKKKDEKNIKKVSPKKIETDEERIEAILSHNLMMSKGKKHNEYHGDDRFGLLDL